MAFQNQLQQGLNNIPQKKLEEKKLALIANCPVCSKSDRSLKQISDGLCAKCSVHILLFNRYAEANIPLDYWDIEMLNFKGSQSLAKFYDELDIKKMYSIGQSYFLVGTQGTGKTTLATNILKLATQKNYSGIYSTLSDIVATQLYAPDNVKYETSRELSLTDVLVIDEVDNRFAPSENAADLFGRSLEPTLRTRLQNRIPTILISNSPEPTEMFNGALKASLGSLFSGIKVIVAVGEDFRKTPDHQYKILNNPFIKTI